MLFKYELKFLNYQKGFKKTFIADLTNPILIQPVLENNKIRALTQTTAKKIILKIIIYRIIL